MARSKPNPHIVESREQAEGTMAEIAALDRKLAALTVSMNKELDAAKEKAAQAAAPLAARRKELESGLAVFAVLNRKELFPDGAKTLDLGFGVVGLRHRLHQRQQRGGPAAYRAGSPRRRFRPHAHRAGQAASGPAFAGQLQSRGGGLGTGFFCFPASSGFASPLVEYHKSTLPRPKLAFLAGKQNSTRAVRSAKRPLPDKGRGKTFRLV